MDIEVVTRNRKTLYRVNKFYFKDDFLVLNLNVLNSDGKVVKRPGIDFMIPKELVIAMQNKL
ncbi:MAG: hypothetical protein ACE5K4_04320 [Candidatus Hydrothermarchaeota archaeon]